MSSQIPIPTDGDGLKWAKSFIAHMRKNGWTLEQIDEDLMLGWFANAIEIGRDELHKESDRRVREAIGCTYAAMCTYAMNGKDVTNIEFPEIAENVQKALEKGI